MKLTRFLLDDLRDIHAEVICRSAKAAYIVLETQRFDYYMFDHDLGSTKPGTSGYDVLKWALENKYIPAGSIVEFVTSNPVGRQNMANQIISHGGFKRGSCYVVG